LTGTGERRGLRVRILAQLPLRGRRCDLPLGLLAAGFQLSAISKGTEGEVCSVSRILRRLAASPSVLVFATVASCDS
jgi:hypothetical protein